jgi:cytochrome bd ubiquinol oxidase subunit II
MDAYLPIIWAVLIGTGVALYVVLDGFDLGIGILFPFAQSERDRDHMISSIAPFWDGNETWLVLGGGGLLAAFPRAYSIIMPALYLPIIVMLLALVFRGVAFEFRTVSRNKSGWDIAFAVGSFLAALCQGAILAGLLQGIKVENGAFAGHAFDWATPFAALCALGIAAGYALLGALWLVIKTEGSLQERSREQAKLLLPIVLAFLAAVSIWTPLADARIAQRWFSVPNIFYLWPVPIATAAAAFFAWRWLERGAEVLPFLAAIGLFLLAYLGLAISAYPYLVPPTLTITQAAAAPSSQMFLLIGTLVLLPLIIGYFILVHWLFRGKVREGEGY